MTSKRVPYELTAANFVARMRPDSQYTIYQLAAKFKLPTDAVASLTRQLVDEGVIVVVNTPKNRYYVRPEGGKVPQPEPKPIDDMILTVAGRREPPDMKGVWTGHAEAVATRISLCMIARGMR
jgi:hypothetical protein